MAKILHAGKHTRLCATESGWEYVERTNASGIVLIMALTADGKLLLVEQERQPVGARVLELPAGLAGDIPGSEDEALALAASRELEEETGYRAAVMDYVTEGPLSAGLTTEVVTLFHGRDLTRVGPGGGDDSEDIVVHEVPLADVADFLAEAQTRGVMADPKIFAALYFLTRS